MFETLPSNPKPSRQKPLRVTDVTDPRSDYRAYALGQCPGPQRLIWCKDSGILRTTSIERRAAGGDRPLSGGCIKMRPAPIGSPEFPCFEAAVLFCSQRIENLN